MTMKIDDEHSRNNKHMFPAQSAKCLTLQQAGLEALPIAVAQEIWHRHKQQRSLHFTRICHPHVPCSYYFASQILCRSQPPNILSYSSQSAPFDKSDSIAIRLWATFDLAFCSPGTLLDRRSDSLCWEARLYPRLSTAYLLPCAPEMLHHQFSDYW